MKWVKIKHAGLHLTFNNKMFKTPAIVPVYEGHLEKFKSMLKKLCINNYTICDTDPSITVNIVKKSSLRKTNDLETPLFQPTQQNIDIDNVDNLDDLLDSVE